jgi:uncharacterized protein
MSRFGAALVAAALILLGAGASADDRPIPPLSGRVVDQTGTLEKQQIAALEDRLKAFETAKGSQIVVLITSTTFPEPIESYSIRAAEAWRIGRKGVDDGILIVIAKSDRAMRIEVGYGLEGALPDAMVRRLIDEVFIPAFKEGAFFDGLGAGIDRLIRVIDGEPLPEPAHPNAGKGDPRSIETWFVLFMVIVVAVGGVVRAAIGRLPAAAAVGVITGVLAWLIVAPILVAVAAGLVGFFLTLLGGAGGRFGGGLGSGGFGSGGFGGGGFRGGGGGFGGGGASGRW